jgi:pimeloyl-ACP methyl ester carboxylesterase
VKRVKTAVLDIAYDERGDAGAPVVLLLHGFPDDPRAWDKIVPDLEREGFRTLAPYSRGFGHTRFLDDDTPRSGQTAALVQDAVDFADALGIERFILVGHDWGGRVAYPLAAVFPERVTAVIALASPYSSGVPKIDAHAELSVDQAAAYWYQWYFNTDKGREALESNRAELCRELWRRWSPSWRYSKATFDRTAESFENPDFVDVVLHSYRGRWENAVPDPRYDELERQMAKQHKIDAPTVVLIGAEDGATLPKASEEKEMHFSGRYRRRVLRGTGHFIPREDPESVIDAVLAVRD